MAGRKLVSTVYVHEEDGTYKVYGPDDDVPADVAKRINNPKAWGASETADESVSDDADESGLPPKGGQGSGVDAWLAYADAEGIDVPEDASRDDVIAAVEAAQ